MNHHPSSKGRLYWLDLARWLSAFFVVAEHLRAAMFVNFSDLDGFDVFDQVFYFCTTLGHQAVMVFFVLSGYFVGGSVLQQRLNFNYGVYLINRIARLWVVLIPGLVVTFYLDSVSEFFNADLLAGGDQNVLNSGPAANVYSNSLATFIGNLSFLQNVYVPVFGSNGPLWSLTNEFWYYMVFPLAVSVVVGRPTMRTFSAIGVLIISYFFWEELWVGFSIWLFGAGVAWVHQNVRFEFETGHGMITLLLFVLALVVSETRLLSNTISDFLIGISFGALILVLGSCNEVWKTGSMMTRITVFFSEMSYSLYLFHFPMILVLYSLYFESDRLEPNVLSFVLFFLIMIFLIGYGALAWWLFERHTLLIRGYVLRRFGLRGSSE